MRIGIIAGHRKSNQGAYGSGGLSEFKYWTEFGKELTEYVNNIDNVDAKFYQRQDKRGYTRNMIELHKRLDADNTDVAIEFHFNGSSNKRVKGHEVFYSSKKGKHLGNILNNSLAEYYTREWGKDMPNRGVKRLSSPKQDGYQFVKRGNSVCLLVEPFFSAHQDRFMKGSQGYDILMSTFIDFIDEIAKLKMLFWNYR